MTKDDSTPKEDQKKETKPEPFEGVLKAEIELLDQLTDGVDRDKDQTPGENVYDTALKRDRAGLAFSGGGIRSATVNLGVIQALAKDRMLSRYDYLSTVSGGGYIGGWLSALIRRRHSDPRPKAPVKQTTQEKTGVWSTLKKRSVALYEQITGNRSPEDTGGDGPFAIPQTKIEKFQLQLEPHPTESTWKPGSGFDPVEDRSIRYLRRFSNFLTPRLGFSGDTLSAVAIVIRNITAMHLALFLVIATIIAITQLLLNVFGCSLFESQCYPGTQSLGLNPRWTIGAAFVLLVFAGVVGGSRINAGEKKEGTAKEEKRRSHSRANSVVLFWILGPTMLAMLFVSVSLAQLAINFPEANRSEWFGLVIVAYALGWRLSLLRRTQQSRIEIRSRGLGRSSHGLAQTLIILACGGILAGGLWWTYEQLKLIPNDLNHWVGLFAVAYGPPLLLALFTFAITVNIVLARRIFSHFEREFIARLNGYMLAISLAWVFLFSIVLFTIPSIGWLSGGGLAAVIAWLSASGGSAWFAQKSDGENGGSSKLLKRLVIRIAPWLFIIGAIVFTTYIFQTSFYKAVGNGLTACEQDCFSPMLDRQIWAFFNVTFLEFLITAVAMFAVTLFYFYQLDVNLFSLHSMYCMRIGRAFLGGTGQETREADPFTRFSEYDDILMSEIGDQRPIHIVNAAINATGGDDLAWQTRRAASFSFTPEWSGFQTANSQGELLGEYRPTSQYAQGRNLGTWVAVSGAAASPNMGYHTSPAVAALLTAYNLRLGRWCGNPQNDHVWDQGSPTFASQPIFNELTGTANLRSRWINLTDGGHFENLGVYELIRRRCRLIVVVDAGCDPDHEFFDLANMIRKCWVDFGVNVRMPDMSNLRLDKEGLCKNHFVVGRIEYNTEKKYSTSEHNPTKRAKQPTKSSKKNGVILYVKSSLTGSEWPDIRQYADSHPTFPHETTADQFFDEEQFEAYRHLGFKMMRFLHNGIKDIVDPDKEKGIERTPISELVEKLFQYSLDQEDAIRAARRSEEEDDGLGKKEA
ncbi:MAG: hypothetical protein AAF578_10285 [Pseudomonadota bacterium]